ncbi:MAG: haloacid dehalogenase type II [Pseudomonadota bacterium]
MKMCPKAFIFDVFGTIVDWRNGVATETQQWFETKGLDLDPFEFADAWRSKYQPAMERIRSGNRGYVPLDTLHLENLNELLNERNLDANFSEVEKSELNRAWEKLPPWSDSVPGLTALKKRAIIAPCSNGSIALMTRLAKFGKLPWDCIVGAEVAKNYKPHPQAYLGSVAALGLVPAEVVMVAAHNDDLRAAREVGLKTAFIPRRIEHGEKQTSDLEPNANWNYVIEKIDELLKFPAT